MFLNPFLVLNTAQASCYLLVNAISYSLLPSRYSGYKHDKDLQQELNQLIRKAQKLKGFENLDKKGISIKKSPNITNGNVIALFKTIRVDPLFTNFEQHNPNFKNLTKAQQQAILAHELGHIAYNHTIKSIIFQLTIPACLFSLSILSNIFLPPILVLQVANIVVTSVILLIFNYFIQPAFSRYQERQADRFAAEILDKPTDLSSALDCLEANFDIAKKYSKTKNSPSLAKRFIPSWLYDCTKTHPSTASRRIILEELESQKSPKIFS